MAGAEKAFNQLQDAARAYMQEMGVPKHIQEDVLGTPSDQVLVLDEKTIKTHFWGELPYRHEWARARCSRLTEAETARAENYSRRIRGARSASDSGLSASDWADLGEIQKKRSEENKCEIAIIVQRRVDV